MRATICDRGGRRTNRESSNRGGDLPTPGLSLTRDATRNCYRAEQGRARHFDPSGSFLKLELVTKGSCK